uniref:Uncharacterized protein n=1 Tax=Opuntia streptacantha TaxID=393608 RepID=A0A7C8YYX7_OPUST
MTILGLDCAEEAHGSYQCCGYCFLCYPFLLLQSHCWGYSHTWLLSSQLHSHKKISTLFHSTSVPFKLFPCLVDFGALLGCASLGIKLPMLSTNVIIHTQ